MSEESPPVAAASTEDRGANLQKGCVYFIVLMCLLDPVLFALAGHYWFEWW